MCIFMDLFLLKSCLILWLFLLFKYGNVENLLTVSINKEPDRKHHKENLKFLCRSRLARVYYVISMQSHDSLPHIRNEAKLREIKKGKVNLDNYADGVASIHHTAIVENINRTCS